MKILAAAFAAAFLLAPVAAEAASPYPRLEQRLRAALPAMLDASADEPAPADSAAGEIEWTDPAAPPAEPDADLAAVDILRALLEQRLGEADAIAARYASEWSAAHAGETEVQPADALWLEYLAFGGLAAELLLDDAALHWIEARLGAVEPHGAAMFRVLHAGRALRQRDVAGAIRQLESLRREARADCALPEEEQAGLCELELEDPGSELAEALPELRRRSTGQGHSPLHRIGLDAAPLVVELNPRRRCGTGMLPWSFTAWPDSINIAIAFGDLDGAIAHGLHDSVLSPRADIDARLPDLLFARYGEAAVRREFALAAQRIETRTLPAGRVVVTTLFGHELRLPSGTVSTPHPGNPEAASAERTEYTTLAEHQAHLQDSALYQALFVAPEEAGGLW